MWVRVASLASLSHPDALACVPHAGAEVLVVVEGSRPCAVDNVCPHLGAPLTAGYRRKGWIECPMHSWRFDLSTGRGLSHPGADLRTYPTRVVDGMVEVELPEP
ncbi:MAG: Rieske (2Fe-2S) protein [Acidimicrobiales bacterium]